MSRGCEYSNLSLSHRSVTFPALPAMRFQFKLRIYKSFFRRRSRERWEGGIDIGHGRWIDGCPKIKMQSASRMHAILLRPALLMVVRQLMQITVATLYTTFQNLNVRRRLQPSISVSSVDCTRGTIRPSTHEGIPSNSISVDCIFQVLMAHWIWDVKFNAKSLKLSMADSELPGNPLFCCYCRPDATCTHDWNHSDDILYILSANKLNVWTLSEVNLVNPLIITKLWAHNNDVNF